MSFWVKQAFAGLLALLLLAAPPAMAQVPGPSANDLLMGLDNQQGNLNRDGYAHAAGPLYGDLAPLRASALNVMLRAGQEYTIAGVCDRQCGDLDLRLVDPRGVRIASDVAADATPTIRIRPAVTGRHTIEVGMIACNAPSCWFAVDVYTR